MFHILFASRLVHEKGVDILIDAIEYFMNKEEYRDILSWDICSDGTYTDEIRDLEKKYTHVTYHGKVPRERLKELYKKANILFMPSRFLEIFGLTALEALEIGTPVIGPRKGGLKELIPESLELDEDNPIESLEKILKRCIGGENISLPDISVFSRDSWNTRLENLTHGQSEIVIIHDYEHKIGGAEYYVGSLIESLRAIEKNVSFHAYRGTTTAWKRRVMFVFSLFAFWRGVVLWRVLMRQKPTLLWLHSILRYIGPWGALAMRLYQYRTGARIILCHHDLGLLTAFPQDITTESMIPESTNLSEFIPQYSSSLKKIISIFKWCYVRLILSLLGENVEHMVFSPFLVPYVQKQTKKEDIILFPHCSL